MPRRCTICAHKKRSTIDRALVERQPFRSIADQFGVSKTSLIRHHDDHLPAALDRARYERFARFLQDQGMIEEALPSAAYAVELE